MPGWLGLLLALMPIVLAAAFGTRQVRESKRARPGPIVPDGWVPAHGVVVDERTWPRDGRTRDGTVQPVRQPIITFQSADGREITFVSRIHAAGMPRVGALVDVFHDPDDPTMACIAPASMPDVTPPLGLAEKWVIWNIWILAVVVVLIFGLVFLNA